MLDFGTLVAIAVTGIALGVAAGRATLTLVFAVAAFLVQPASDAPRA